MRTPLLFFFSLLAWGGEVMGQCTFTANAGPVNITVCGGETTQLNGTANGGTPPYVYLWTPATGLSNQNIANPTFTLSAGLTYTLTVTDGSGSVCTDDIDVVIDPSPTPVINCTDPSVLVSIFNGVTTFSMCDPGFSSYDFPFQDASTALPGTLNINWGNGNSTAPGAVGWSSLQNYQLGLTPLTYTINNSNNCSVTTNYYVFIGQEPGLTAGTDPNTSRCVGDSLPFYLGNTALNPPGTEYILDFGDNTTATFQHPPPDTVWHVYNTSSCGQPGNEFEVHVEARNPCDYREITIRPDQDIRGADSCIQHPPR
ncbi:MAG: hypothetical protein IPO12_11245 [Flavobacteriales bacterium]|nr:hypothetical protein [Flavobacteriales bacterium]